MSAALLAGVLGASIVGSVHCIAMCGPLVGLHGGARTFRLSLSHSLGRLATYVALGTLAGLVGSAIDLAGRLGNVQRAATIVGAVTIVAIAIVPLATARWRRAAPTRSPFTAALVRIRSRSEVRRAALIGALTGLLPCGWLWAFVVMAAGTASAPVGALVMATFWLGTAPAMIGVVRLAGPLIARMRARMPAITAVVLIAAGLGTLALRWQDAGTTQVRTPHCHGDS